jgi:hypothetical protein
MACDRLRTDRHCCAQAPPSTAVGDDCPPLPPKLRRTSAPASHQDSFGTRPRAPTTWSCQTCQSACPREPRIRPSRIPCVGPRPLYNKVEQTLRKFSGCARPQCPHRAVDRQEQQTNPRQEGCTQVYEAHGIGRGGGAGGSRTPRACHTVTPQRRRMPSHSLVGPRRL